MAIELVREYLKAYGRDQDIIELDTSSATVELAAQALGTGPERIAKTLSFMGRDHALLVVCAGDCKIDNHKFKETFHVKARMLKADEVEKYTNHAVGGVCPFANSDGVRTYLDVSLQRFETVFPAAGSSNSAIQLTCDELAEYSHSLGWIDVCKGWQETP